MLGAIAICSDSASRQAEGGGAAVAAGGSLSKGACFATAGCSDPVAGASAGRGIGNGERLSAGDWFAATGFSDPIAGASAGRGLGNGLQKLFYLPQPHTDFLFAGVQRSNRCRSQYDY